MRRSAAVILYAVLILGLFLNPASAADWMWAKGILHAHTTNSDGDSSPQAVADWYKDHGYHFLAITDHEKLTDPVPLDKDPNDSFILIPGEELAVTGQGVPIHANALGLGKVLSSPKRSLTSGRTVRQVVELIRGADALPMINHPNWFFALNHRDLLYVSGPYLLEIANHNEGSKNAGDIAHLSTEQTWDILLSEGRTVYATATDDMHSLKRTTGECIAGRGWVYTRVKELTPNAVMDALRTGQFYASVGVELKDYSVNGREFKVSVAPKKDTTYVIRYVGKYGRILQETMGTSATYRIPANQEPNSYIRCKVIASDNTVAWTQAFRIEDRSK